MTDKKKALKYFDKPVINAQLSNIHKKLCRHIRNEESSYGNAKSAPDTLTGHLQRVASYAVRLASKEGVDLVSAELAGLFHDAGKFHDGKYHEGNKPEEEYSIEVLHELAGSDGLDAAMIAEVSDAIRQLYRDDPLPTPLSMVLFDADNLDKIGLVGIANYFIKSGLRGQGITAALLTDLTIELTYARYASRRFYTKTGRAIAGRRSSDTIRFIHDFLETLKEDCLFDAHIEHAQVSDVELDVVTPSACPCGASMGINRTWIEQGVKCTEIHLEMACTVCGNRHKIKFCRPMFVV
jgi:uncharacterized protein